MGVYMDARIEKLQGKIADLQAELGALTGTTPMPQCATRACGSVCLDNVAPPEKPERFATLSYMWNLPLHVHLSGPFVYGMILPVAFLDLALVIFQAVCFRLWGIARVERRDFVIVDRHQLDYLNGVEKLNCIFCGYANGVFAFAQELAARTEQFWCPIKHAHAVRRPHTQYKDFVAFGDADAWNDHPARKTKRKL